MLDSFKGKNNLFKRKKNVSLLYAILLNNKRKHIVLGCKVNQETKFEI